MRRTTFASVCLVLMAASAAVGGKRPSTIEEFYKTEAGTRVIAHRGFSGAAPENTLAAVRAAIEVGADMAEIDVTLSADMHVVVIHDATLDRTTNGSGEVSRFALEDLRKLDAGSWFDPSFAGEIIPTLDEVLTEVDGRILLNVEIKSEAVDRGVVKRVAAEIRRRRMCDRVVISSFSPTALDQMRAVAPEIRTAILYNTEFHTGRDAVEITAEVGASVFNIKRQRLTRKMRRRCRQHGIPIGVYTVNKPRRMRRLVKKKIAAIFTDYPDQLLEILRTARDESAVPALALATAVP